MATLVYDGDGDDGWGNLFAGTKFFFMHRLPTRERWMNLVKSNAGQIVKLEKQADIVIADHAKKDCPPGSISWKYIQDSVKDGELKDIEEYRAGSSTHSPRAVGSSQPVKKGRTPFTVEDDRVLADWVLNAERSGLKTRGNEIYQQLEAINNRHTAQSWRDRWVKYLSPMKRPDSGNIQPASTASGARHSAVADRSTQRPAPQAKAPKEPTIPSRKSAEPGNQPQNQTPRSSPESAAPSKNDSAARSIANVGRGDARPYVAKSVGGTTFTNEEIKLLEKNRDAIMNLDEDKTINAWIAWAAENPNHTAQEWHNCFAELVAPRIREKTRKRAEKSSSRIEIENVSTVTRRSSSPSQESFRRATTSSLPISINAAPKSIPTIENARPLVKQEIAFRKKLTSIARAQKLKVIFDPVICARTVPLFRLWQVVNSEELGGFSEVTRRCLWPVVARRLNFNDFQHSNAAKDLEACYSEILLILDDAEEEYETTELSESEEQELIEAQLRTTAERETQKIAEDLVHAAVERQRRESSDDRNIPSSVSQEQTPTSLRKRRLDHSRSNLGATSHSWSKRQRIEKGKGKEREIPSTPELGSDNDPLPHPSHKTPQLESTSLTTPEDIEGGESELFVKPLQKVNLSPTLPRAVQRVMEPETQDFHFPIEQRDEAGSASPLPSTRPGKTHNESRNTEVRDKAAGDISTQSQTDAKHEADLNSFVEHYISLGYSGDHVTQALDSTTLNAGDVGIVMENLRGGKGIPKDIQGVWTSSDDEAVEGKDHPRFKEALEKHGMDRVNLRRRFLADQKAARKQLSRRNVDT